MRTMYDGIYADQVPAGAAIYAGYVGGEWLSYAALAAAHPSALHVSIAVNASEAARALDVETGDATPAEAPGWVERERAAGNPYPVVYMNTTTWPAVKAEFAAQKVAPPLYWVAAYVTDPSKPPAVPAGAIAIQYYDFGGYDASVVADYWPGVDPAPTPSAPTAQALEEDQMPQQIEPLSVHPGEYAYALATARTELALTADGYGDPPAQLRIAIWDQNSCVVLDDVEIGGATGVHSFGHTLLPGTTGVTIRRLDGEDYPVGVDFK